MSLFYLLYYPISSITTVEGSSSSSTGRGEGGWSNGIDACEDAPKEFHYSGLGIASHQSRDYDLRHLRPIRIIAPHLV